MLTSQTDQQPLKPQNHHWQYIYH